MTAHLLQRGRRWYRCSRCCDFCMCTADLRAPELSWGDLTANALWKHTLTMTDHNDPSPWCQIADFQKDRRLLDLMHVVHSGVLRDQIASMLFDVFEEGSLRKFYGMPAAATVDEVLCMVSFHAQRWANDNSMELRIGTLTSAALGRHEHSHWPYPELSSRVKAAKTRTLFAFCVFLMTRLAHPRHVPLDILPHAKARAVCFWALDVALSIWNKSTLCVLSVEETVVSVWLCKLHSTAYQWLSVKCMRDRRLLYKVRPKTHYFCHITDWVAQSHFNPQTLSNFCDEDFMGKTRNIAAACHGSTYMTNWARRYALKRGLAWTKRAAFFDNTLAWTFAYL